jgi:outer membrane protein OmpA-like peptidoglycan-associated protein
VTGISAAESRNGSNQEWIFMSKLNTWRKGYHQQPRWLRVSEWCLLAYLLYALLLGLITPYVLTAKLPTALSQSLGREVTIETISINPFLLRVRVANFRIAEADQQGDFIRFTQLEADAAFWRTLLTFTPTLEHFYLNGPYARLAREQGGDTTEFNFSDIIRHVQSQSSPEEINEESGDESGIPHLRLGLLNVTDGKVEVFDRVSGAELVYPDLALELANLDTRATISDNARSEEQGSPENLYQVNVTTTEGGTVYVDGLFQLAPLALTGKVVIKKLALPPLWPLSDDIIKARLTEGTLDFSVGYDMRETEQGFRFRANDGQLAVHSLALSDTTRQRIALDRFSLTDVRLDTDSQRVDIAGLNLKAPYINGIYDNEGLDLVSLLMPAGIAQNNAEPEDNSQPEETTAWQVVLGELAISEGDVQLHDKAVAQSMYWRVHPIEVTTSEIDSHFSTPVDYEVSLAISGNSQAIPENAQGEVTTRGSADLATQAVVGELTLSDIALSQVQSYLTPFVNLSLSEGALSATTRYDVAESGKTLLVSGDVTVDNLTILDGLHYEPLVKWQSLDVADLRFSLDDNTLDIASVNITEPYAKILIDEQKRTNIGAIIRSDESSSDDASQTGNSEGSVNTPETGVVEDSPLAISIAAINLNNGSAYFADESLTPQFASSIESLNGSIEQLTSDAGSAAKVAINGKIDSYAPVSLKGEINPLLEELFLDLDFAVEGAELTSVNPYSGTYMGYYIDKGLLSLDVRYKVQNSELDGNNHVVIDQLTLGRKSDSEQALSLPLGLAVALLQDNDGVIDLGLEVSGDLDNPDFSFGSIILNALGNLITKAVTAPFTFLASLVGSEDELNRVDFAAGQDSLDEQAKQRLTTLAEALNKRPGLRVSIEGTVDAVSDARELAVAQLHQQLLERSAQDALPDNFSASNVPLEGPLASTLETLFSETFSDSVQDEQQRIRAQLQNNNEEPVTEQQVTRALHIAMYNRLRDSIFIPESELAALAQERGKRVKAYLVNQAQVEAGRLFLLNSREHLQSQSSSVELSLQADYKD